MQGNWLKVGDLLINIDRIVAINTQAKWAVNTKKGQDADAGHVVSEMEQRKGVEIVLDIDPEGLSLNHLGLENHGHSEGLFKLRYTAESPEARQILNQCTGNF